MNIIRSKRPDIGWTTISQTVFRADLDLKQLGLLCYLLSLPEDWVVHTSQLCTQFKIGKNTARSLVRHLRQIGFVHYQPGRRTNGRYTSPHYIVNDLPEPQKRAPINRAP